MSGLNDALGELVVQRFSDRVNPMSKVITSMMARDEAEGELQLDQQRVAFIDSLKAKLAEAKESDGEVTEAYRRLIQKHSMKL